MEQENSEWISLGFVYGTIQPIGKNYANYVYVELFVKVVLSIKVYALKYKDVMYRIATSDKEGKVYVEMSDGLGRFTIPSL